MKINGSNNNTTLKYCALMASPNGVGREETYPKTNCTKR
jgi:hypothetical protein